MLGLGRLMVELCRFRVLPAVTGALLPAVALLARLCDRAWPCPSALWPPAGSDWRGTLNLVAEAAVCVVSPGGNLTGRVGDLTFGLTKPVLAAAGCRVGGFFADDGPDVDVVADPGFAALVLAFEADAFSGCETFFSGVLLRGFGVAVAGLFEGLDTVGDFVGFAAVLPVVLTGATDFPVDLPALAAGLEGSLATAFPFPLSLSFSLLVPLGDAPAGGIGLVPVTADLSVGPPTAIVVFTSSSSTVLSGFIGGAKALPLGDLETGGLGIRGTESVRGDSGIGCSLRLVLLIGAFSAFASGGALVLSCEFVLDRLGVSRSPLSFLVDTPLTLESRLVSRCKPKRPSFSIAMKFVRILEIGLGDSVPSAGLENMSVLCRQDSRTR